MERGTGETALSNRQRKQLTKRIRAEQAALPKPAPVAREVYEKPEIKHADDTIIPGLSGKGAVLRMDTLGKLLRDGKINHTHYSAGLDYLRIVENFYSSNSGLARISEEAPNAGGNADPIRLYAKARRVYASTQKPRNVSRAPTAFDGISSSKAQAIDEKRRLMRVLSTIDPESLLALYGLVIHPSLPSKRCLSVSAYSKHRYGHDNTRAMGRTLQHLVVALTTLHNEYGERLDKAA